MFNFNSIENLSYCSGIVSEFTSLLYYTHIPSALITLLLGFFVFRKSSNLLLSKILFAISIFFSIWALLNLSIWLNFDNSSFVMTAWAPIELIKMTIFLLCWYFVYVFTKKKDLPFAQKILWLLVLSPLAIFSTTEQNLVSYDLAECIATENTLFSVYAYYANILVIALTTLHLIIAFFKEKLREERVKILILSFGVLAFIFSFFILGQISESTENYVYEMYGLFGMILFTGVLGHLIVRYHLFQVKLFAVQLLVIALVILTGAQFTFADSPTSFVLTAITVLLSLFFGILLIRSVRNEIHQKENLEELSDKLAEANVHLQDLDKMKTEFLSLASHQLRSPLTAIKGYASMLLEGSYGQIVPEQKVPVDRIFQSSVNLAQIVEDLLDVSKMEQGGMKFEMADVDLVGILKGLTNELQVSAKSRNLDLVFETNLAEAIVEVDSVKIRQVFANYVDNALKYTEKGTVKISIAKSDDGKKIVVGVKDSGMGIPPEIMKTLFKKFERGEGGKVNAGGSGLGLYLAKEIVSAHKGRTWAESEGRGKGSTFFVELSLK